MLLIWLCLLTNPEDALRCPESSLSILRKNYSSQATLKIASSGCGRISPHPAFVGVYGGVTTVPVTPVGGGGCTPLATLSGA